VATLLIVDDDRRMVEYLRGKLVLLGHTCHLETDGERALKLLEEHDVDLLLLDVMLPGLSGFQLCRKLRSNPAYHGLPIIFISAMNSEEEIAHGLAQGADDYVTKPFVVEVLARRIDGLLAANGGQTTVDPVTKLPNAKAIKLTVQKAVNEKTEFVLAYLELLRVSEFGRVLGPEARDKALRHFARMIRACADELEASPFEAGHLGGGHFVCLLAPGQAKPFTKMVVKGWDKHLPKLYGDLGQEKAYAQAREKGGKADSLVIIEPLVCMTSHQSKAPVSYAEHFEILSHLRQTALNQGEGFFVDRRR